jgi:CRISPR-associated endoribonuclease Cas6
MRCLARLTAARDQVYQPDYHAKLQGALYSILDEAGYGFIHRERPFKFVTFSNIFPPEDMEEGDSRTWLVAGPHDDLIKDVADVLRGRHDLRVGDRRYYIDGVTTFDISPDREGRMETATPIIVRIPDWRCREYGIDPEYDDVYWVHDHPTEAFKTEIERNLASKYEEYYDEEPPDRPYFTDYVPRRDVALPVHYEDRRVQVIGTTWEFGYETSTREMYRLVKLAFDAGVGEMNTTGFGFINEM